MAALKWCGLAAGLMAFSAMAQDYPAPKDGAFATKAFRFHTGEVLPELRQHYLTIGSPSGEPVVIMHGTGGSGAKFLGKDYAGELFGPGQPLDAQKYFIILPDAIGAGQSSKPSDGLRMKFPRYNYDDMVEAQYLLLTQGLGLKHVRAVTGNSMGGMETWIFGERYPDFMDALIPMASSPSEMSARNWMMRRLLIETIKADPEWHGGDYSAQPRALRLANVWLSTGTSGGTRGYRALAPTRERADKLIDDRLAAPVGGDANDTIYQFDASRDYNPAPGLEASGRRCWPSIRAMTSAIRLNSGSWKRRCRASPMRSFISFPPATKRAGMARRAWRGSGSSPLRRS